MKEKTFKALKPLPITLLFILITAVIKHEVWQIALIEYAIAATYAIITAPHSLRGVACLYMLDVVVAYATVGCVLALVITGRDPESGRAGINAASWIWAVLIYVFGVSTKILTTLTALTASEEPKSHE